jgi:hypothetical protein
VSLFFAVLRRCETGTRKGCRAAGQHGARFCENAAEELFQTGVFFLTPRRTNGKLKHFPPSEEMQLLELEQLANGNWPKPDLVLGI